MRPGSTAWLLVHEARLRWRALSGTSRTLTVVFLSVFGALLFVAGWGLSLVMNSLEIRLEKSSVVAVLAIAGLMFSLMLAQTLSSAVESFYVRRDLDLLLSSPLPAARVLAARFLALAAATAALPLFFLTPPALGLAAFGHPRWLGTPLSTAALALAATAVGLWLAMALFALIGPRRTRTAAQVLGAFSGALVFLAAQTFNWMPDSWREALGDRWAGFARSGVFAPDSPAAWPARAVLGEPGPLAAWLGCSLLLFAGSSLVLGRRFAENAAAAAGRDAGRVRAAVGDARPFSRGAFRATIRKELRLIGRDPALMSQVLLRLLYMVPLLALLWRAADHNATAALAGLATGVTFLTGQLAGSLARITVTTEDAPDLLSCAPASPALVRRGKLAAALLPVAVLLTLPLAALSAFAPLAGMAAALACAGAAASSGLIILWLGKPIKRSEFNKQQGVGNLAANIADILLGLLWGVAAYLGVRFGWAGLAPAAIALLGLLALRRPASGYAY